MDKQKLEQYARLIVELGGNVQKGQPVLISAPVSQEPLALAVTEAAYRAGASLVSMEWTSVAKTRADYLMAGEEALSQVYPWQEERAKQQLADGTLLIQIVGDDPDGLKGTDPRKVGAVSQRRLKVLRPYQEELTNHYQWVVAGAASPAWAKKLFPEDGEEAAVEKLWEAIFACVRLDGGDPAARWKEHVGRIGEKCGWLNAQRFVSLEYRASNGTRMEVGLIPDSHWVGASSTAPANGAVYLPNLPTEEIFTTPRKGAAEGTLISTKPLSWQGQLMDGFSITFRGGKAVDCHAQVGEEALRQMLAMDEGARFLGEVALVPKESPVNRSGLLFYSTLFDENACCHMAVGQGYPECLDGWEGLTAQELEARGANQSLIHVDFMIGTEDLEIDGVRADGSRAAVFRGGTWAE